MTIRGTAGRIALAAALATGAAFVATPQAHAQDGAEPDASQEGGERTADGRTIVVTATRAPVAQEDAPATVSLIDETQIADDLVTDIRDLIRFEPGISVTRQPARFGAALGTTGRAGNEGFTVRGIGGNRVLIQVDGIRVPDGFGFGAQLAGRGDYVDVGLVKSVEILRGPASGLYGSDGLAGAVSFVTSDPVDFLADGKNVGGLVRGAYSSADQEFSETAIVAGRSGNLSGMIAYTRRDWHELDNQGTNDSIGAARTTPNPQDGRSNAVLGRLVYETGGHRLRLTGEYLDTYVFTDVLSGTNVVSAGTTIDLLHGRDTGERKRISADWSWNGDGTVEYARAAAYWQDSDDVQFTDEDRSPAADRERLNTFENRVYGASGEVRLGFGVGHRVILGGDISFTRQEGLRDGVTPPAGEAFPTRAFPATDYMLAGAFLSGEFVLGPLTVYPALRFDAYDLDPTDDPLLPTFAGAAQDGSRLSPKIGAVLKATDTVRLFANYAQGFKAPEASQVNNYFANPPVGYTSIPNPNLRPETSKSFEGGIRFNNEFLSADIAVFHADYDDFIAQVETTGRPFPSPAAPWIYQWVNLGRVKIDGAEGRLTVRPGSGITATLAVSYAEGVSINAAGARTPLDTIDPMKAVLGLAYATPDGRFGGRFTTTYGGQKERAKTTATQFRPDDFVTLDLTAYARIVDGLTLRAGIFNITDAKYWSWTNIRGLAATSGIRDAFTDPGRNASVSLSYRF